MNIQDIKDHYLSPKYNGSSLFELWLSKSEVGSSIVPSIYIEEYKEIITKFLYKYIKADYSPILSIGSGVGCIEKILFHKYKNIYCIDVLPDAVERLLNYGIKAKTIDIFSLDINSMDKQELIYLDGTVGHLFENFSTTASNNQLFAKIFYILSNILKKNCYIIFSDDVPFNNKNFEMHSSQLYIRVSDNFFVSQVERYGFIVQELFHYSYFRPQIGNVLRRIICIKKP